VVETWTANVVQEILELDRLNVSLTHQLHADTQKHGNSPSVLGDLSMSVPTAVMYI